MKYDVIVVLAGGIQEDGKLPRAVIDRIQGAKRFYDAGHANRILMSGKHSPYWNGRQPSSTEAALMSRYAESLGIPSSDIFREEASSNTIENALYSSRSFLEPNTWKKALVVTSDFHVRRTRFAFLAVLPQGYSIECVGVRHHVKWEKSFLWWCKEWFLTARWFGENILYRRKQGRIG